MKKKVHRPNIIASMRCAVKARVLLVIAENMPVAFFACNFTIYYIQPIIEIEALFEDQVN